MSRRVVWKVSHAAAAGAQPEKTSDTLDKIAEYIPGEIIALWAALAAAAQLAPSESHLVLLWVAAGVGLVLTPLYVYARIKKEDKDLNRDKSFPYNEVILSTVSFAFWVFAIGGPFAKLDWYHTAYGSFALLIWSAISGFIPKL